MPTQPSSSPVRIIASAFRSEPLARVIEATRPSVISEKYSAGPKVSARADSGAAKAAMRNVEIVPAMKEPMAAMLSATPARPWRAIWWPSMAVTAEEASPGRLIRMAVVEPPYWAP